MMDNFLERKPLHEMSPKEILEHVMFHRQQVNGDKELSGLFKQPRKSSQPSKSEAGTENRLRR